MKTLIALLMIASHASAKIEGIDIHGWDKKVTVTVFKDGKSFKLETTSDELDKYLNDKKNAITDFVKEVRNENSSR